MLSYHKEVAMMKKEHNCSKCEYKDNCELNLYMVYPCECEMIRHIDNMGHSTYVYRNAITGEMQNEPLDAYYLRNPFMYYHYKEV